MPEDMIKPYFEKDHERLDRLFEEFQVTKACDIVGAREPFENFRRVLERHMAWEEEILFPLFESKTGLKGEGPTQVMRLEHEHLRMLLKNLQEKINHKEAADDDQENELIAYLAQHNHKEENMLYPMIDGSITPEERQAVFKKIHGAPETGHRRLLLRYPQS